ncbi:hypothetical protein AB0B66_42605 [Catellatospora sp. NPDC049111]|uniref:hypothetical protein n=1 Tax=Catellatospora sp. NPDC049111 TaxID=3155271 RepID=UPI0034015BA0
MESTAVTLAVDIGEQDTVAVAAVGSRRIPVLFGAATSIPSAVTLPPHADATDAVVIADPYTSLADGDGVRAVAVLLRQVADAATAAAGTINHLMLTAPPAWGPRRHTLLRQAAAQAALPEPVVVPAPVAASAHAHSVDPVPDGGCVLVCDSGTAGTDVSLVQHRDGSWQLLSAIPAPDAGLQALEQALSDHLPVGVPQGSGPVADGESSAVRAALAQLTGTGRAAIVLPDPHPPVLITRDHLQQPAARMREALLAAAAEAVTAADIDPEQLAAIVVGGDAATLIDAATAFEQRFALTPTPLPTGRLARAHGALDSHQPTTPPVSAPVSAARVRVRHLAAVILPSVAAGAMALQAIVDTDRLIPDHLTYTTDDYAKISAYFNMPQYATAAMFTTWAAIAAGRFAAAALLHPDTADTPPGRNASRAGKILAFTAAIGLAIAGLFGLLGDAIFGGPPGTAPDFLTPALIAATPAAAVTATIGIAAPHVPALRGKPWADPLHHPVTAMLLAAAGIIGMEAAWMGGLPIELPIPDDLLVIAGGRGGAALLGVAVTLTLTRHRAAATALAAVLGLGFAIVHVPTNDSILITIYLVAAAAWWIRQAAAVALLAIPNGTFKQLLGN